MALEERFWSKVQIGEPNECWEWQASCMVDTGYGSFCTDGRRGKTVKAHRVAWELTNGPILNGAHVLHACDNRKCCNPVHLFLGTQQDNVDDKVNKDRQAKGEQHGMVKLTESQVVEIRQLYPSRTQQQLADDYHVCPAHVSDIILRKRWKHI